MHSTTVYNRILSKVQKSFWSCTHVNSCQKYTLYINLHILLNILSKATSNIQESRKSSTAQGAEGNITHTAIASYSYSTLQLKKGPTLPGPIFPTLHIFLYNIFIK